MNAYLSDLPHGMEINGLITPKALHLLTPEALAFLATLHRNFNRQRLNLLERRVRRQAEINMGKQPDFLVETRDIRESDWSIAPIPEVLKDRRVEITGPTSRKMVINALNSGAKIFMADFEDSNAPTWNNMLEGQINLLESIRGTIEYTSPEGKEYKLNPETATVLVRPRGWHLEEKHVLVDGEAMSGSLFDFGLYFFHNVKALIEKGSGPYFYLPKLESHLEARLWNDVFILAQQTLNIPQGTIKATVLIETILAAFEMHEILYELRDHAAGLNCGRWDYIFSCIKKFHHNPDFVLADRALITMATPFMRAYSLLLIQTCHRRRAHAIGGMAAQIPIKNDEQANATAMEKVREDKLREVTDGHDGTWVAHPGLVPLAMTIFDTHMPTPHQIARKRSDVQVTAQDLLNFKPEAPITETGMRQNIRVGFEYLQAWLAGNGCVPINNLMEDAATAEISRSQLWQWIHSPRGILADGRKVTTELFRTLADEELAGLPDSQAARQIFDRLVTAGQFTEFLTLPGYEMLIPEFRKATSHV